MTFPKICKSTVLIWGLVLSAAAASADAPCDGIVRDLDLSAQEKLPSEQSRWTAIERLWGESADAAREDVNNWLASGSLNPAADLIQGRTNDVLREALVHHRDPLAHSLLNLWRLPFDVLAQRDHVLIYSQTPSGHVSNAVFDKTYEMWVGPDGMESVLYSAMYLAGATDLTLAIARRSPSSRTTEMTEFARRISELALSHYKRWAFGPPKMWQVREWGCGDTNLDLVEFTARRLDRRLGNGHADYCIAPTDLDMLIAIGIANLLSVSEIARDIAIVGEDDRRHLLDLLKLLAQLMASRLAFSDITDEKGQSLPSVNFDPGAWNTHPDVAFAGEESQQFPSIPKPGRKELGWDFSHGWRIAWTILTFAGHSNMLGGQTNWDEVANALARQVAYRVLDDTAELPRFRNFLDGSNGWYRVNIRDRTGSGVPPFGLSRAFLAAPWARLSHRDSRLMEATSSMWRALAKPDSAQCELLKQVYVDGSYWQDHKPAGAAISGPLYNMNLLPFLAVAPAMAN
jgi:hypothetical protein